jgi:Zn-dependent membrane protease YugP
MYLLLPLLVMLASWAVSSRFKSKFKLYTETLSASGLSGKEIAEKMLHDHGIFDVNVVTVDTMLGDHYNPVNKTVNLSSEVYYGRTVAACAVAAHECGHAVQHARAYAWLNIRSSLVPFVSLTGNYISWIILAGILTIGIFPYLLLFGILLFALTTLFSFITLPVEMDASRRGLAWLESSRLSSGNELNMAKDALYWAGMTYVVAALGSLATLIYYINTFLRRS